MKTINPVSNVESKQDFYHKVCEQLEALLGDEIDLVANAANTSALLALLLPDVNWVGFYFLQGEELVLGPFQGKPACVRIPLGKGVCGSAGANRTTLIVPDVHEFEGHIACDTASRSEIVVPLVNWGQLLGVLDVDSPTVARFDEDDCEGLESVASIFVASQAVDMPNLEVEAKSVSI